MRQWSESGFWNDLFVLVELRIIEWRSCEAMEAPVLAAMAASTSGKSGNLHTCNARLCALLYLYALGYGRIAVAVAGMGLLLMERCSEADPRCSQDAFDEQSDVKAGLSL